MTYLEGAIYLVIAQLIVVSILNLKSKIQSNRILGVLLIIFADAIRKTFIPLYIDGTYFNILVLNFHLDMMYGPLIYLYLRSKQSIISRQTIFRNCIFPILYISTLTGGMLIYRLFSEEISSYYVNLLVTETRAALFFIYFSLTLFFIKSEKWGIVKHENRYRLFVYLIGSCLSIYYFNLFLMKYAYQFVSDNQFFFSAFSFSIFLFSILFLVYYGATELNKLKSLFLTSNNQNINTRYSVFDKIESSIEELFSKEKVHLDSDLNLEYLASKLKVKKVDVSDFIRTKKQTTFYDFLNEWRVKEFKVKLKDSRYNHLDILGVAYESGFQSKATFNRAFKKIENCTPRDYKKSLLKEVD